MVNTQTIKKTLLAITVSSLVSSIAFAQLRPGNPGNGGGNNGRPPSYNPCDVPTDPNCRGNGNGGGHYNPPPRPNHPVRPGNPGHGNGGYPGHGNGGYPSYPSNPYPDYPSYPNDPGYYSEYKTVYVNRAFYNQSINLRSLFGFDSRYNGYRIVSVTASTTPNSPATTIAQLVVDGQVYASQRNPGYRINLFPNYTVRLNRMSTAVHLYISGSTYINSIQVEISRY